MRLRLIAALIIFAGSYLPLSVIFLAQDGDLSALQKSWVNLVNHHPSFALPFHHAHLSVSAFVLCGVCFIVTVCLLRFIEKKRSIQIVDAEYIPADLINYTFPYIVSFMGVDYADKQKLIGFLIFLMWLFWITFRSGQIALNPLLIGVGWRLYKISYSFDGDKRKYSGMALARSAVVAGNSYKHTVVQDVLLLESQQAI